MLILLAFALACGLVPVVQGTPPNAWTLLGVGLAAIALWRILTRRL